MSVSLCLPRDNGMLTIDYLCSGDLLAYLLEEADDSQLKYYCLSTASGC